jgi:hypothetical protein
MRIRLYLHLDLEPLGGASASLVPSPRTIFHLIVPGEGVCPLSLRKPRTAHSTRY